MTPTDDTDAASGLDPRRFRLVREEDETGVSGTGVVAVGVVFPAGTAVLSWVNDSREEGPDTNEDSVYVYPGGEHDVDEVHGHDGRTRVEFLDPPREVLEGDAVECPDCEAVVPIGEFRGDGAGNRPGCPACGGGTDAAERLSRQ